VRIRIRVSVIRFLLKAGWRRHDAEQEAPRDSEQRAQVPPPEPVPEPTPEAPQQPEPETEPEPEPEREPAPVPEPPPPPEPVHLAAVPNVEAEEAVEPDPDDEPEVVVPLVQRDRTPREWNIWELERIMAETEGADPQADEERALLLMNLRQVADPSGELPVEFDPLVRDAFGGALLQGHV
jgi:hypothetical protein